MTNDEIIALAEKHCDFIRIYSDSEVRHYLFTPEQLQSFAAALAAQPAAPAVVKGRPKRDTVNPCVVCGWSEHMAIHHSGTVGHSYQAPPEGKQS